MLVRYRGKNNEGVLEKPGTKWKVLRAISSTLKCQFQENVEKLTFRCHVRPNRLKICMYDRMPRAVILETPKPPQFKPDLSKTQFLAAGPVGSAEVNRTPTCTWCKASLSCVSETCETCT